MVNEIFMSTVLGGLIAILPGLIDRLIDRSTEKARLAHDCKIKQLEIYGVAKKEAIEELMSAMGKISIHSSELIEDRSHLTESAQIASLYVRSDTAEQLWIVANRIIEQSYSGRIAPEVKKETMRQIELLCRVLSLEMQDLVLTRQKSSLPTGQPKSHKSA